MGECQALSTLRGQLRAEQRAKDRAADAAAVAARDVARLESELRDVRVDCNAWRTVALRAASAAKPV